MHLYPNQSQKSDEDVASTVIASIAFGRRGRNCSPHRDSLDIVLGAAVFRSRGKNLSHRLGGGVGENIAKVTKQHSKRIGIYMDFIYGIYFAHRKS